MKKFSSDAALVVVMVALVLSVEVSGQVTCRAVELSPCLSPITNGSPPSGTCCTKLREQRPCLCQYLRDPNLRPYVSSPNAEKLRRACGVPSPNC